MRLSGRNIVMIGALIGLISIASTGQIAPATSEYQAQMRVWLAARATGITAYLRGVSAFFYFLVSSRLV